MVGPYLCLQNSLAPSYRVYCSFRLKKNVILEQTLDRESELKLFRQTAVRELTDMKTSRFLTETSYPDVPGGILSSSYLSILPSLLEVLHSCARSRWSI